MTFSVRGWIRCATLEKAISVLALFSLFCLIENNVTVFTGWNISSDSPSSLTIPGCSRQCPVVEPRVIVLNSTTTLFDQISPAHTILDKPSRDHASCPSCVTTVMTFVDYSYLDTLSLWLHYYQQLDNSHRVLCLFVLSDKAFMAIQRVMTSIPENVRTKFGRVVIVRAVLPPKFKGNAALWAYRVRTLSQFLNALPHQNVLFTDLDAFWLRDPQIFFPSPSQNQHGNHPHPHPHPGNTGVDIVASRGEFPQKCPLLWQAQAQKRLPGIIQRSDGGTLVFGFIFFQNTLATRQVAAELVQQTYQDASFDDQYALNCQLYHHYNLSSSQDLGDGSYLLKYSFPRQNIVSTDLVDKEANNDNEKDDDPDPNHHGNPSSSLVTIRILSPSQVVRRCDKTNHVTHNSTVVHCLSKKSQKAKAQSAQSFGLVPANVIMYDWGDESEQQQQQQQ